LFVGACGLPLGTPPPWAPDAPGGGPGQPGGHALERLRGAGPHGQVRSSLHTNPSQGFLPPRGPQGFPPRNPRASPPGIPRAPVVGPPAHGLNQGGEGRHGRPPPSRGRRVIHPCKADTRSICAEATKAASAPRPESRPKSLQQFTDSSFSRNRPRALICASCRCPVAPLAAFPRGPRDPRGTRTSPIPLQTPGGAGARGPRPRAAGGRRPGGRRRPLVRPQRGRERGRGRGGVDLRTGISFPRPPWPPAAGVPSFQWGCPCDAAEPRALPGGGQG